MKKRLDVVLVQQGLVSSREKAKALIASGAVRLGDKPAEKPGQQVEEDAKLQVIASGPQFVSRGGYKLQKAVECFQLSLLGARCMDIGASTGGFTDCMLQCGAAMVYAVDVGTGQLDARLCRDERVINWEQTNIRQLVAPQLEGNLDFISIDVSFISLSLVVPVAIRCLRPQGRLVCLVKPQFEAGRGRVGKNGVVRESSIHREVLLEVIKCARQIGFGVLGVDFSPIKGPEGNIEYLLLLEKESALQKVGEREIETVVAVSHQTLDEANGRGR